MRPEAIAVAVPELAEDEAIRRRAARFIGAVAVGSYEESTRHESALTVQPRESLHQAVQEAAYGNMEARKMVETNVKTDVIERTMKRGHVMKVDLMVDEAGRIQQHGQAMKSVQANSLRFAANCWQMRERTEAETRNTFRIEALHRNGELQDHYFVVFSRAADNMSKTDMRDVGFFTGTMSCAIQVTGGESDRLTTESAFVAGAKQKDGPRHDAETVAAVARYFGIDISGKSATEVLDTPLKIPKELLPNGATDLVRIYDECAGGTFFGEDKPHQDYDAYKQVCAEREARFAPKIEKIVEQLLREHKSITSPVEAVRRLHEISGEQMLEQAIGDTDIDPEVFGPVSAIALEQARLAYYRGDAEEVIAKIQLAKTYRRDSSCPGGVPGRNGELENSQGTDSEECEFISKKCPECGAKNVKTKVTKHRISGRCGCSKSK